jgi:hypothetical protein
LQKIICEMENSYSEALNVSFLYRR